MFQAVTVEHGSATGPWGPRVRPVPTGKGLLKGKACAGRTSPGAFEVSVGPGFTFPVPKPS